ncbi:hypothetical protein [Amycolatopsis sp. DG1A-15b]|uniref:hypothetical protein n=1 Tax=Amycolatopsis sp. DG1A-15b TaxID=3052846 RepID=UPI00255B5BFD|nr:hypothetical protein [Amycolatopsis sp. DG1A-15b]WIX85694.1 hypothetical protein QRY02_31340 [Amycolatopsis sp. DG1A-15b]
MPSASTARISSGSIRVGAPKVIAVDAVAGPQEHVYAAHFLFWDTVTVAEIATGRRPTDRLLADALWGAAAVTLHPERLSTSTIDTLTQPGAAAGLSAASWRRLAVPVGRAASSPGSCRHARGPACRK